jgi:predicted RNA binding protein YcfA (HicA-like mRNA interferase family)
MVSRADLEHWRRYPANITAADLMRAATERGWVLSQVSGSHHKYRKAGYPRHLVIPMNVHASGTKRAIIDILMQAEMEADSNG